MSNYKPSARVFCETTFNDIEQKKALEDKNIAFKSRSVSKNAVAIVPDNNVYLIVVERSHRHRLLTDFEFV